MGKEIERKFLVTSDAYKTQGKGSYYRQSYLCNTVEKVVRVRIADHKGYLTLKGANNGITRLEFEYEIPVAEAQQMLDAFCTKPDIEKTRYRIPFEGYVWEVDEFMGENEGLVVAEIELPSEDATFVKPDWVGVEVSDDDRYYNSNLIRNPFSKW